MCVWLRASSFRWLWQGGAISIAEIFNSTIYNSSFQSNSANVRKRFTVAQLLPLWLCLIKQYWCWTCSFFCLFWSIPPTRKYQMLSYDNWSYAKWMDQSIVTACIKIKQPWPSASLYIPEHETLHYNQIWMLVDCLQSSEYNAPFITKNANGNWSHVGNSIEHDCLSYDQSSIIAHCL